jgi:hypothetical protein
MMRTLSATTIVRPMPAMVGIELAGDQRVLDSALPADIGRRRQAALDGETHVARRDRP